MTTTLLFLQHRNDDNNMVSTHTATKATGETATTTSTLSKQQQDYHRARLLNRLGIHDDTQQQQQSNKSNKRQRVIRPIILTAAEQRQQQILRSQGGGYIINASPRDDGGNIRSPETGVKVAKTNLNCDFSHLPVATTTTKTTKTTEEEEERKGTRITFCEKVDVVLIPTRHEYSNRIKSLIWSDPQELQENAMRNTREFAAEDWKWENAIEDESMYVCSVSGELIHPIHMQHHLVPA